MLRGQYRTISIVQYFRRRGAKQVPAEEAGVCRHDDEIEFVLPGKLNDLYRRIAQQQDSWALSKGKLGFEERIEFLSSKVLLLFGNLGKWPYVELERVVTVEIEDVNQCHFGAEHSRRPLHVGDHSNAGRRVVYREQDVLDRRHGFGPHIGFNNMMGPVLKTESLLELTLKSSIHQARTAVTPSSFRTIGATTVPRISMASNIFLCGSVETPIWNVMREMPPRTSFT